MTTKNREIAENKNLAGYDETCILSGKIAMPQFGRWIKGVSPSDSVSRAARRSVRARLKAVEHFLPLAALQSDEHIEYVHQLRVWTRRASAVLDLYSDLLPSSEEEWFRKTLHEIRRAAGKARDLDVLHSTHEADKGKGAREFLADLKTRRERAQEPIVSIHRKLSRRNELRRRTKKLRKKTGRTNQESFGPWASAKLEQTAQRFFKASSFETHNLKKLHKFRIRGKELRYAMELLAPAFPKSFRKKLYPVVSELQTRIGAIHDRAVAVARFEEWLARSTSKRRTRHVKKLLSAERKHLEILLGEFHDWWTPEFASELRESFERLTKCDGHGESCARADRIIALSMTRSIVKHSSS